MANTCFFCNGNNKPLLRSLEGATAATAAPSCRIKRFAVRATKSTAFQTACLLLPLQKKHKILCFFCNGNNKHAV